MPPSDTRIGISHAHKSNPAAGGEISTVGPYSCTNDCSTKSSDCPLVTRSETSLISFCANAHGPANAPPLCVHFPAASLHPPHIHMMRSLKALTFVEGASCARIGAEKLAARTSAHPAKTSASAKIRIRESLIIGVAYAHRYARGSRRGFSLRVKNNSQLTIGNEREDRAEHENKSAEPDPFHQRIQIGVNGWAVVLGIASGVDDVKIARQRRMQRDHCLCDFACGVEATLRIEHHHRAIALEDFDGGALRVVIRVGSLVVILRDERVRPNIHL